jgi:vitamin B12 transporter
VLHTHRVERLISTGALTFNKQLPTAAAFSRRPASARIGLRRGLGDGYYLRAAAYASFRPPTLNELNRPFGVGSDLTESNPNLKPEKL